MDAKQIAKLMESEPLDVVLSSPYKRAVQTVEPIAQFFQLEVEIVEDFKERQLAAHPVADFESAILQVWEDETFAFEGGESNRIAQQRGIHALRNVLIQYYNKNIVIGTHGNIMVLIMNYFQKEYDFTFWSNLEMPDIYKLSFDKNELIKIQRIWRKACSE